MTDDSVDREALRDHARDPRLIALRSRTADAVAGTLREAGKLLQLEGHIFGDGRTSGSSQRSNGDDSHVAVGVLTQIGSDLLSAAGALLCGTNHYAGAALLRQVVEVEYLTWAFAHEKRDASAWLNSTHQDRMKLFTPSRLRGLSDGRFLAADYRHHCEQGGHPVPKAIPLIGNPDTAVAQMLMVDLLLHSWRTTDNLIAWAESEGSLDLFRQPTISAQRTFGDWGRADPLYTWSLTAPTAPPP